MTRKELAGYIELFDLYKRNMMDYTKHADCLIHAMTSQLICDEVNDSVVRNVIKEYHENAANMVYEATHEMEALMDMFMELSQKEEES